MKNFRKNQGITLIALVITVIILLILAGVTIGTLTGDNGILTRAQEAKNKTEEAQKKEEDALEDASDIIDSILGGEKATTVAEARGGMKYNNTTAILDDSGGTVYIPGGFKISEESATNIDSGIVITDGTNEFVWVPVEDYTTMYAEASEIILSGSESGVTETIDIYSKIRGATEGTPGNTTYGEYREPDILPASSAGDVSTELGRGIDQLKNVLGIEGNTNEDVLNNFAKSIIEEYTAIYNSIKEYKGFYIGRYELTGTVNSPTVKAGETLVDENWYSLKKACTSLVTENQYAQTTMIYSNQWDETMHWLKSTVFKTATDPVDVDSGSWGNFLDTDVYNSEGTNIIKANGENKVLKTGITTYTMKNNIYDLAGNCHEWTQGAFSTGDRVFRGGICNQSSSYLPASSYSYGRPYTTSEKSTTRVSLYIK